MNISTTKYNVKYIRAARSIGGYKVCHITLWNSVSHLKRSLVLSRQPDRGEGTGHRGGHQRGACGAISTRAGVGPGRRRRRRPPLLPSGDASLASRRAGWVRGAVEGAQRGQGLSLEAPRSNHSNASSGSATSNPETAAADAGATSNSVFADLCQIDPAGTGAPDLDSADISLGGIRSDGSSGTGPGGVATRGSPGSR